MKFADQVAQGDENLKLIRDNAGRDVEYELRAGLLAKLHTLGPSFFRRMPVGEVMTRTTSDLAQVRMLVRWVAAMTCWSTRAGSATAQLVAPPWARAAPMRAPSRAVKSLPTAGSALSGRQPFPDHTDGSAATTAV